MDRTLYHKYDRTTQYVWLKIQYYLQLQHIFSQLLLKKLFAKMQIKNINSESACKIFNCYVFSHKLVF